MEALPLSGLCGLRVMFSAHLFNVPFSIFSRIYFLLIYVWIGNMPLIGSVRISSPSSESSCCARSREQGNRLGKHPKIHTIFLSGVVRGVLPFRQRMNALAHVLLQPALIRMPAELPGSSTLWDLHSAHVNRKEKKEGGTAWKGKKGKGERKERSKAEHSKPTEQWDLATCLKTLVHKPNWSHTLLWTFTS